MCFLPTIIITVNLLEKHITKSQWPIWLKIFCCFWCKTTIDDSFNPIHPPLLVFFMLPATKMEQEVSNSPSTPKDILCYNLRYLCRVVFKIEVLKVRPILYFFKKSQNCSSQVMNRDNMGFMYMFIGQIFKHNPFFEVS